MTVAALRDREFFFQVNAFFAPSGGRRDELQIGGFVPFIWGAKLMRAPTSEAKLYSLIELIYAAAPPPHEWRAFLSEFVNAVPGTSAAILVRSYSADRGLHVLHENFPPGAMEDYIKNHAETSPWVATLKNAELGKPFATEEHVPLSTIEQTLFYRNFLKPNGIGAGFGVKLWDRADGRATFFVTCAFEDSDRLRPIVMPLMERIAPHLTRALATGWALRRERLSGLEEGLASQSDAVLILNARGELLSCNRAAQELLDAGHVGIDPGKRQIQLPVRKENGALQAIIKQCTEVPPADRRPVRHLISFTAPGLTNPNVLEIRSLSSREVVGGNALFSDSTKEPHSLVTIRLRNRFKAPALDDIRNVLDLSPKEAEVALGLAEGHSPEALAKIRGVSVGTIRWHLKNVYQRVGCSSQAELVRLMLSLFGPAAPG